MKKRVVLTVIIVLVFGGLLCLHPERSMAANQTGVVTATSLNVRTGAGTTYAVLQYNGAEVKLSNGTKVSIAETLPG